MAHCHANADPAPSGGFRWTNGVNWIKASGNTAMCLLGCSIGDFGTILFFQIYQIPWPAMAIMGLAMVNGILTSIALETVVMSFQMPLRAAFRTAIGMSLISMIAMETAMNATDLLLVGEAKLVWWVLPFMLLAGFLTALPYNYWRLEALGKSCH